MFQPSLPTDSLYKMSTIGGLLLIILAFYIQNKEFEIQDSDMKVKINFLNEALILKNERDLLSQEELLYNYMLNKNNIGEKLKEFEKFKNVSKSMKYETDELQLMYLKTRIISVDTTNYLIKQRLAVIVDKLIANNLLMINHDDLREIELLNKDKSSRLTLIILLLVGSILYCSGTFFWYHNQQKLQDEILFLELENLKTQNNNKSISEPKKKKE